uniref:Uncharacterized protein n=1 Tax=Arundo donax TaxID=35708 RepID=A0A0A9AKN5_ARUDO
MNTKGFGTTSQHKAYCGKHSVQQKEADAQQYGPEELKSMKRMRVELEKLRLLCERIIKREKVKVCLAGISTTYLVPRKLNYTSMLLLTIHFYLTVMLKLEIHHGDIVYSLFLTFLFYTTFSSLLHVWSFHIFNSCCKDQGME